MRLDKKKDFLQTLQRRVQRGIGRDSTEFMRKLAEDVQRELLPKPLLRHGLLDPDLNQVSKLASRSKITMAFSLCVRSTLIAVKLRA